MSSQPPLISVIVPVYNVEQWLGSCLESLCNQSYRNLEIICVEDASLDNSAQILGFYASRDPRIKIIMQQNAGLSGARNSGLAHATGDWVTGVDSDDWLLPDIYESVVPFLTDDVDMLMFGTDVVDDENNALLEKRQNYFRMVPPQIRGGDSPRTAEITPNLPQRINVCFWNKLWRRSIITNHSLRFPEGLIHEDEAFIRLFLPFARRWCYVPKIGYKYRLRQGSIMDNANRQDMQKKFSDCLSIGTFLHKAYTQGDPVPFAYEYLSAYLYHVYSLIQRNGGDWAAWAPLVEACRSMGGTPHDYRLPPLQPQSRISRFFVQKERCARIFRIGPIPLLMLRYGEDGKLAEWQTLAGIALASVKRLLKK